MKEYIQQLSPDKLVPFQNHPYQVREDAALSELMESIRTHGILSPLLARPKGESYELVSGHRRRLAAQKLGLKTVPVLVREMSDDEAVILMVDSNLQRENLLPSEKAFAYKMKLEAMKHQGERGDLTSGQVGQKLKWSVAMVANQSGDSIKQVQRYIRLTELLPELLDLVDERKFAFNSAVEVSYLNPEEQGWLAETIDSEQSTPSLSQAQRLKRFSQDGKLTEDMVLAIMSEQKKPETERVVLQSRQISQYFSPSATPKEMETSILSMLDTAKEWRSYFPEDSTLDDVNRRMRKVLEGMKRTKSRAPER